jgi:dTDP-4-amino-4,6-dideoxygalactose transaminase
MVLTDNPDFYEYLKMASYDGRDLLTPYDSKEHVRVLGYHYYMTPEDAARGLLLMRKIKEEGDSGTWENYPNLRQWLKEL